MSIDKPHKDGHQKPIEGGQNPLSLKVEELSRKLKEAEEKAGEFKELAQRVQAEFENFLKRSEKEKAEFRAHAGVGVVKDLLPVLDSFDGAIEAMKKEQSPDGKKALEGLLLLRKQLFSALERHGLQEMHAKGKKFDHNLHDCYISESDPVKEDDIVTEEIQKGYMLNGKVLRTSKVKVNKLDKEEKE